METNNTYNTFTTGGYCHKCGKYIGTASHIWYVNGNQPICEVCSHYDLIAKIENMDKLIDENDRRIKELEDLNRLKALDIKALEERIDRLNDMKEIARLKE